MATITYRGRLLAVIMLLSLATACQTESGAAPTSLPSPTTDALGTAIALQAQATRVPTATPWPSATVTPSPSVTPTPTASPGVTPTLAVLLVSAQATPTPYPTNTPRPTLTATSIPTLPPVTVEAALLTDAQATGTAEFLAALHASRSKPGPTFVEEVKLFESVLLPRGPQYTPRASCALGAARGRSVGEG